MVNKDKILVVDRVTKEYPGRSAVSGISFEVRRGSIHGFLGPNGAGKSTTMKMIAGLIPTSSGSITLDGHVVSPHNLLLKNTVGFLSENPPLYMDMKVEDYLNFVARLHHVKNISDKAEKVMTDLSLLEVRNRLIGNLSKGFKQRVGLAQAIIYDAPFLILDEPTNGLDPQSVVELREFIKRLATEKTILFSSHVLSEVEQLCDQITIIHQGQIRATGDLHEIHQKFKQGLVLTIGIGPGEELPDLLRFGRYHISHAQDLGRERQFHVVFENDNDCRAELGKFLIQEGIHLYTMLVQSPELEDIFLHLTEQKK
jgi:ABC-2 type transport system ATP-binding protein